VLVDMAAVGLDLQCDAAGGEELEQLPGVRHPERFAAAEGDIRNTRSDDAAGEVEGLAAGELVAPGAVRARFLAAGDAARAAAVGELPGKKQRRAKLLN
jgi:hypothetical protein